MLNCKTISGNQAGFCSTYV